MTRWESENASCASLKLTLCFAMFAASCVPLEFHSHQYAESLAGCQHLVPYLPSPPGLGSSSVLTFDVWKNKRCTVQESNLQSIPGVECSSQQAKKRRPIMGRLEKNRENLDRTKSRASGAERRPDPGHLLRAAGCCWAQEPLPHQLRSPTERAFLLSR